MLLNKLFSLCKHTYYFGYKKCYILYLKYFFSPRKIKGEVCNDIVVSVTTHGKRINTLHLTIKSILFGKVLPKKIFIWIDDVDILNNLPPELSVLKSDILDIRLTKNFGPHTKYYPYLLKGDFSYKLVTADDDIIYPKRWLKDLNVISLQSPGNVICHRAHLINLENDSSLSDYNEWSECRTTLPSYRHFATGVSGVLYPTSLQEKIFGEGDAFKFKCPKADDIWLHYNAVKFGFKVIQVRDKPFHFPIINDTQDIGLLNSNVFDNKNQLQIANTYSQDVIKKIHSDSKLYMD